MTRRVQNAVILDGPAAAMLWTRLGLSEHRVRARGQDERFYGLLMDIYFTALAWHDSARGNLRPGATESAEAESTSSTTPEQVARRLGVTARTIRNAIAKGELPAVKYGRVWLIEPTDADAFVQSKQQA